MSRRRTEAFLPRFAVGRLGRLAVVAFFAVLIAFDFYFQDIVLRSNPPVENPLARAQSFYSLALYLSGMAVGPLWAVLDDRATDQPKSAMMRGSALGWIVSTAPVVIRDISRLTLKPTGIYLEEYVYDLRLYESVTRFRIGGMATLSLLALLVFLGTSTRLSPSRNSRKTLLTPSLVGPGGRFACAATLAVAGMLVAKATMAASIYLHHSLDWAALIAFVLFLLSLVASALIGPAWSVLDDRTTKQPWLAALRATCLCVSWLNIGSIASDHRALKAMSIDFSAMNADLTGLGSFEIVAVVLSSVIFVLTPVPKLEDKVASASTT